MSDSPASVLFDENGNAVSVLNDDGTYRVAVTGIVLLGRLPPPAGALPITIFANDPLEVQFEEDTEHIITNGKTFYLQELVAGAAGDPSERGSRIEVIYDDASEHLVERVYVTGFTHTMGYLNVNKARDETSMVGDGSTKKVIVRRTRLSGVRLEVDVVVKGFEL